MRNIYTRDDIKYIEEEFLESCPFCGCKAKFISVGISGYSVRCTNRACEAEQAVYPDIHLAIARWNTRA